MYSLNTFMYTVFVSESPLDSVNLYSKESEPTKLLLLVYVAVDEDNVTVPFCGCDTISYSKELSLNQNQVNVYLSIHQLLQNDKNQ